MQNPRSHLLQKTAFSPRTAKFIFIALLAFTIALTSLSVQAAPSKAIIYSSSSNNPSQIGLFSIQPTGRDRQKIAQIHYFSDENQRISIVQADGKLLAQWKSPGINWSRSNLIWSPNSQQVAYYHL